MGKYVGHIEQKYRDGTTVDNPHIISANTLDEAADIGESIARGMGIGGIKTECTGVHQLPEGRSIHHFPPGV